MMIPRYDAIETFDIKLEQAKTQETAVFALQAAGDLIEESQRIIEPMIRRPAINRLSGMIWPAPAIVRRPGTR